jgi:response regulator RpfG family c-di-GMP phosphodiesterase
MTVAPSTRLQDASLAIPGSGPAKVLLLTQSRQSMGPLDTILSKQGLLLERVGSPEAAAASIRGTGAPEVVLLEWPGDGSRLLTWVESLVNDASETGILLCLLLLVPATETAQAVAAVQAGAYDFVTQPYLPEQLLHAIARAIEYRRLRAQNDLHRYHLEQLITARTKILQNAMQQLEQSYDVTLEALGNALDLKDAETEGHSKRVTAYTLALGRAMGLSEPLLRIVGRGAFLHDIGKMAIPDAILRKPGKLTESEMSIMRTHSELGNL